MNTTETLLDSLQADAPVGQVLVGAFWTAVVLNIEDGRIVGQGQHEDLIESNPAYQRLCCRQ